MLSFPPHCSHMMQPLDKTVFGPLKKYYAAAMKGWLADHKGQPISIYNVPSLVANAYPKAMTPENITSGFRATGIFPHNRNVFPPHAFLPAQVTDRPDPTVTQQSGAEPPISPRQTSSVSMADQELVDNSPPQTSSVSMTDQELVDTVDNSAPQTSSVVSPIVTPSAIRPFTRAPPRKRPTQNRLGSTRILTDTPVKNDIAMKKLKKVKLTTAALPGKRTSKKSTSTPGMTISKKSISSKRKLWASTAPSDDANPPCLYCNELFLNSVKEFRAWIQCQGNCKKWCHRVCAGKGKEEKYFVCELCFTA